MNQNKVMKGNILEEHGGLEKLIYSEKLSVQPIKEDEIKVKVEYCGLNHLDIWLRKGGTGDRLSLPRIPGSDVVGTVVELGTEVDKVAIGDKVVLYPGKGCGECYECSQGRETLCKNFEVLGYNNDGGYCEYVSIQGKRAIKVEHSNEQQWAGVPVAYVTAWNALVSKGKMSAKDTVVIWGASGGLGYAAMSIAQSFGAKVIGIISNEEKASFLKQKGFKEVEFIIRDENVVKNIRKLTDGYGVDLVLDHVGKKTFNNSLKMLKKGGRLSFCGVTTGPIAEVDLRLIFGKQITITGSWMGDLSDFHEVVQFLLRTKSFPFINKIFSLSEAKNAQDMLENGEHIGKIILKV